MKYLLILVLIFGVGQASFGKCGSGLAVFPETESISPDGHIIIEAYGWGKSHELLKLLGQKYPIYLNSVEGKINLIQKDHIRGAKSWSQVLLIPEKKLVKGQVYTLVVEKLLPDDQIYLNPNRLYRNGKFKKAFWTVADETRSHKENNIINYKHKSSNVTHYGCGPSVETSFEVVSSHKTNSMILTEILEVETGKKSSYYLIINNKEIKVGHGMCSGPYSFIKDKTYKIRFNANFSNDQDDFTEWIVCRNPWRTEEDTNDDKR